jgi:hypothetical protein
MSTAIRISSPTQQGARLSWGSDLFQRCSNVIEQASNTFESVPVPQVCEASWSAWDAAVLELDLAQCRGLS